MPKIGGAVVKHLAYIFSLLISLSSLLYSQKYNSVLFLGNSITHCNPMPDYGWLGNWGMAASAENKDYVHKFKFLIDSTQQTNLNYTICGLVGYEADFFKVSFEPYLPDSTFLPDLIIFEIGDNVIPDTAKKYNFGGYYRSALRTLKNRYSNAQIISTTKFWPNPAIDTMIINAATENRTLLADLSPLSLDSSNEAGTERNFSNSSVGIHPGDKGMNNIAKIVFKVLMYCRNTGTNVTEELSLPSDFRLMQNYPNPFNPETRIGYWLPDGGKVLLRIFDLLGREVETLVDRVQEAGKYEVVWKAGNRGSGVYFCSITAGSYHSVKKMILIK
jgi:Secretion system C-terminal sorting domain